MRKLIIEKCYYTMEDLNEMPKKELLKIFDDLYLTGHSVVKVDNEYTIEKTVYTYR